MSCRSKKTQSHPKIIFVSGRSNSGKTTLIERLIPKLKERGIRVGTVKHAHEGFDMDHPGKDSWRHAQAGADAVTVVSPKQIAFLLRTEEEIAIRQTIQQMAPYVDLILVEGYKALDGPKILLEHGTKTTVSIDHELCRIGVGPHALSSLEMERIVKFLLAHARTKDLYRIVAESDKVLTF
ncbi:MAG: molybdopterin-guanine dinucleotide biosynthesis protein B [Candidatus Omnitrophica bacterium]|nr:molybdopterin-guanine dinucleotide biosynthesis protein B [Candidatus Omnitrophota bacterium]